MDVPPECSGHSHDHQDHASDDLGLSLRPLIDFLGVTCHNEDVLGTGKAVLKLYEERCTETPTLRSPDDDPELLLHIPFTEAVTVHSITVRSVTHHHRDDNHTAAPRTLKLFVNRDALDFETAREAPADATLQLLPPEHYTEGTIDYPLRPAGRFQNISSLQLFFVDNYSMPMRQQQQQQQQQDEYGYQDDNHNDDDNRQDRDEEIAATEISYIGLKGQGTKMRRVAVETVYESQGMMKDHKTPGNEFSSGHFVG